MSRTKQPSKKKRSSKVVPVLGAAGLSLTLASGASAATGGPVADLCTQSTAAGHEITLREEEVADVSLATFYVFDKENAVTLRPRVRIAMGMCGGCAGCGGCGCWTGTYYTSSVFGGDGYAPPPPPRPRYYAHKPTPKKY